MILLPIKGEKQALATPRVNIILSLIRIKFGFFKLSDKTRIRFCNST